ncbi:MAG TPA: LacI family DNA-binding transcriptional regulator [Acidimicrobiales bacterium]|nr:LacI family DNA-binding transcriptional regulator [Acidimicrobiales bacterium]
MGRSQEQTLMVTITDVAAHAGVGAGTVSRVLNDSPRVSAQTRARVLASIAQLDYRPNPTARALSRGRCETVGIVVPFFTHASAVERLRGVADALHGSDYDLVLFNVESPVHRDEHFETLSRRGRIDGLMIISLPPTPHHVARLVRNNVHIVLVDARAPGVTAVVTDDVHGGRIATRHLVDLGHRRIAYMGDFVDSPLGFTSSAQREEGYRQVLAETGITFAPELVRHGAHERSVARALTDEFLSLPSRPTAVFAASDVQALGVIEAARAHGLVVPDDLSVIGFDDVEIAAYAGLTTVRQPLFASGRRGAELLLDAIRGDDARTGLDIELPLELTVRTTTCPPRPDDGGRSKPEGG